MSYSETLLSFPCEFPIKAMGKAENDFDTLVIGIVRRHFPEVTEAAVKTRLSNGGKFISVTVTIKAQNQLQLDNIYNDGPKGADEQRPMEPKLALGPRRPMSKNSPDNQCQQQERIQMLEHPDNGKALVKALGFRANRRTVEDSFKIIPDGVGCDEQAQRANRASGQANADRARKGPGEKEWDERQ